jgi:tRNA(Arg) A34 adenosine deaminase TadA
MGSILWARIDKVYYALSPQASSEIGLGDQHLYAEMARPLDERQIVPMINLPDLDKEAIAVYREWLAKPDRVQY